MKSLSLADVQLNTIACEGLDHNFSACEFYNIPEIKLPCFKVKLK